MNEFELFGPPIDVIELFAAERAALLEVLNGLSPEEWQRPTVCESWSVQDVAAHLLADDAGRLSRGRDGHSNPDFGTGLDLDAWDGLLAAIDRQNDLWVRALRRASPHVLIDFLELTGRQVDAFFRSLDPNAMSGPVDWAGPESAPVWLDLAREYTERWLHQQHIREATGRTLLVEPRFFRPVLDAFARALRRAISEVSGTEGEITQLVISGDSGDAWNVQCRSRKWRFVDSARSATTQIMISQEVAWRLFSRGITPAQARTHVATAGRRDVETAILGMVSILA